LLKSTGDGEFPIPCETETGSINDNRIHLNFAAKLCRQSGPLQHITDVINTRVARPGRHISRNPVAMVMSGGAGGITHANLTWDSSIHNLHLHASTAHFLNDFLKYNSKNVKTTVTVEEIERKDIEEQ
ncbi:MAG: hypothetical protein L3J58_12175, partial [Emcibacter sp.]|nr:hypothetical protein [Emcibacter sp.]